MVTRRRNEQELFGKREVVDVSGSIAQPKKLLPIARLRVCDQTTVPASRTRTIPHSSIVC